MAPRGKQILAALLALAAVALAFRFAFRSPQLDLDTYEVLGVVTAEETAKLLNGKGQVLVLVRDTGPDKNPSVEAELRAFQQSLKAHRGLKLLTERIPVTPMLMLATGGSVPPDQLLKVLQTHPDLAALVLFLGFPPLGDAEVDAITKSGVKTVVVSAPTPGYRRLLEQHVIHLAIVPRRDSPEADHPAAPTIRARFDEQFAIVTAANAAQLP